MPDTHEVTRLLREWAEGNQRAVERLRKSRRVEDAGDRWSNGRLQSG